VDVFSAEKENKRKNILEFDIERRDTDLGIFLLRNVIISKSFLRPSDSGDENGPVEVIFGDLISKTSIL
jgi:hypothetical protein